MLNLRIKYLSFFWINFNFIFLMYSYYLNLYLNLNTYYVSFAVSLFIGILFFKLEKKQNKTLYYKILTVFWILIIPLVLSLPFYFSI